VIHLQRVRAAAALIRPHVRRTSLLALGRGRWLKLESLQPTGSFKVRGFVTAALELPVEKRARGLLTVSAGNAALACAYAAHRLGVPCRVVMLDTAPAAKLEGVKQLGGRPLPMPWADLMAWIAARAWEGEPEAFIHPFADETVQVGHATLGLELIEDLPDLARVVVAVGGGGLISGVAAGARALSPAVEVVGVQSSGYPLWPRTFADGAPPDLTPATIADGTTAPYDRAMHDRLAGCVDRWVIVPEARLRAGVAELATTARVVAEGAGALAYCALDQFPDDRPTVAVVSGGNIAPQLLATLLTETVG
jgi:threonine dehydratase